MLHAPENRGQHVSNIIRGADIAGASCERGHPDFIVRNAMGADDGQGWKITVQILDIGQTRVLDIEHDGLRTISRYIVPQFVLGLGYMHGEMRAQSADQGQSHLGILLEDYYTLSHTPPIFNRRQRRT
jgi:hypothetical protein